VLDIEEIKSVPYVPMSHPFVERLIGSVRREWLSRFMEMLLGCEKEKPARRLRFVSNAER
jgi:hypothetical protein